MARVVRVMHEIGTGLGERLMDCGVVSKRYLGRSAESQSHFKKKTLWVMVPA